jgi:hypothetical protein
MVLVLLAICHARFHTDYVSHHNHLEQNDQAHDQDTSKMVD